MNSLQRKMDKTCHSLATVQGRIFEKSVEKGIPSYFFIKSFLLSSLARNLDELNLELSGLTEVEIFNQIKGNIKTKRGQLLPYQIMKFIGYFYRCASYLYNLSSKYLYENIPINTIVNSFNTLHSLPIEEAIKDVFEVNNIQIKSKEELFIEYYKNII